MIWARWLEELRHLPEDAAEWEQIDTLVEAVQRIARDQQEIRLRRYELEQAIADVRTNLEEWITYFRLEGCQSWSAAACPPEQMEVAIQQLAGLRSLIIDYEALDNRPRPATMQDRQQLRQQMEQLEQQIPAMGAALSQRLAPGGVAGEIEAGAPAERRLATPLTGTEIVALEESLPDREEIPGSAESLIPDEEVVAAAEAVESVDQEEELPPHDEPDILFVEVADLQGEEEEPTAEEEIVVLDMAVAAVGGEEEGTEEEPLPDEGVIALEIEAGTFGDEEDLLAYYEETAGLVERVEERPAPSVGPAIVPGEAEKGGGGIKPLPVVRSVIPHRKPIPSRKKPSSDRVQPTLEWQKPMALVEDLQPATEGAANDRLLAFLGTSDLQDAYWLAWSLEMRGIEAAVPSWLISAVQGASWAAMLWPEQPGSLLRDLSRIVWAHKEPLKDCLGWLNVAAALYPALVDPEAGWEKWLDVSLEPLPAASALAKAVAAFSECKLALQPEHLEGLRGVEDRQKAIHRAVEEADEWLRRARERSTAYQRASAVWLEMVTPPDGELYRWYYHVANDRRDKVGEVQQALNQWLDVDWVDDQIQRIDHRLVGRRLSRIEGGARKQIIRWATEACNVASAWSRSVAQEQKLSQQWNWFTEQVEKLVGSVDQLLPLVQDEVHQVQDNGQGPLARICAKHLQQAMADLERVVLCRGEKRSDGPHTTPATYLLQHSLEENLAYRLFWLPEAVLNDSGLPSDEQSGKLAALLAMPVIGSRTAEEAVQGWVGQRDYRFAGHLLSKTADQALWESRYHEALNSDIDWLRHEQEEATATIEQAWVDGLIGEDERSKYSGDIEAVRKQIDLIERKENPAPNIGQQAERLKKVQQELNGKREHRLEDQRQRWGRIAEHLPRIAPRPALLEQIRGAVEDGLEQVALRAVDEYLVHLEEVLGGKQLAVSLFSQPLGRDLLQELNQARPVLIQILDLIQLAQIAEDVRQDKPLPGFPMFRLPSGRRQQAYNALESWRRLKPKDRVALRQENLPLVITLMKYLGFVLDDPSPISLLPVLGDKTRFQHWRVQASAQGFAPVPQFGSLVNGTYDVVGAWDRPGIDLIGSLLEQMKKNPTIVFYFARLLRPQREALLRLARRKNLPVLVLDEQLLLFLVREYDVRLNAFFACTLPLAALNPYVPFVAGSVPPEMFYGREHMVDRLLDPYGPAIIYGGRQLGKSALLKQAQRAFDQPERRQYAILEDIKPLGDPKSDLEYKSTFWHRLGNALTQAGILDTRRAAALPQRLRDSIVQVMADSNIRILLLLDEADNFLEADADQNFRVINDLKSIMDQTDRRFKVIFAGLHNVQRFNRIPNQPLAHLGEQIEVGPLEPDAARDLLERPLKALGYHFGENPAEEDPSLVLHILSYTNYHPGLIQLFGQHLVDHLQKKYQTGEPPFAISRADVETVYREPNVKGAIKDRFIWTLALDERYEAIALSMILDQWETRNGFDRLYTAKEISEIAASWWPEGFGTDVSPDRFEGFLEEMRGLGVLSYGEENRYRLRSPNLVHLMGTEEQLLDRMGEISTKPTPTRLRLESHHALLPDGQYSPLSYSQEGVLNASRAGVGIVFGSDALGIGSLKEATKRFVVQDSLHGPEDWEEIRVLASNGATLRSWLREYIDRHKAYPHLVVYRALSGTPEQLLEQVVAAVEFCTAHVKRALRIVFALDALSSWDWFQVPDRDRSILEQNKVVWVALNRWDQIGIKQRLEQHVPEMIGSDRNCKSILEMTGGWPWLLDQFLSRCQGDDPLPPLQEFEAELTDSSSQLRRRFIKLLSVPRGMPLQLLRAFLQSKEREGVPQELVPLLLENDPPEQVNAALEYLQRMAILERRVHLKSHEPVITLNPAIARLWIDER